MSSVQFELPEIERRHPRIWWGLAFFFGLLVLLQLVGYLDRKPDPEARYRDADLAIRQHFLSRAVAAKLGTKVFAEKNQAFDPVLEELAEAKGREFEAALRWAIIRTEQGRFIEADALAKLRRSTTPRGRAAARVYGGLPLTRDEAGAIAARLDSDKVIDRIVGAHALFKSGDDTALARVVTPGKVVAIMLIVVLGALALFASLVLWAVYVQGRSVGKFVPKGWPRWPMPLLDADRRAALVFGAMALFAVVPIVPALILRGRVPDVVASAFGFALVLLCLALVLRRPVYGKVVPLRDIVGDTRPLGKLVGWGVAGAIANIPIVIVAALIGSAVFRFLPAPDHPAGSELLRDPTPLAIAGFFITAVLGAPLLEEFVFRGLLAPAVAAVRRSAVAGVVISSLVFAAIHPTGVPAWLALASVGAMGALLTIQTGSLVPAIAMHATHNGMLMLLTLAIS